MCFNDKCGLSMVLIFQQLIYITFFPSYLSIGPFGYNEVTMIPAGATHIRVTDNSKNYLGLNKAIFPVSFKINVFFINM